MHNLTVKGSFTNQALLFLSKTLIRQDFLNETGISSAITSSEDLYLSYTFKLKSLSSHSILIAWEKKANCVFLTISFLRCTTESHAALNDCASE